jgi:hypothetical protein
LQSVSGAVLGAVLVVVDVVVADLHQLAEVVV